MYLRVTINTGTNFSEFSEIEDFAKFHTLKINTKSQIDHEYCYYKSFRARILFTQVSSDNSKIFQ